MKDFISPAKEKYASLHQKYSPYYPAAFFILGFIFDIFTLDRIDHWLPITQQAVYLIIVSWILNLRILESYGKLTVSPRWQKIWYYNNEILHFFLGSLLSAFTLFYFVSSSLAASLSFMAIMGALLIINELPGLQGARSQIKVALFAICLFTYFIYLLPIFLSFVGLLPLLLAIALGLGVFWYITKRLMRKGIERPLAIREIFYPAVSVAAALLILYFARVLPPIPLAIQYIGIYHNVERQADEFHLSYERPWWKFWQSGAQSFVAEPGDRVYVFARIFSPARFNDEVIFHWLTHSEQRGWQTSDRVSVKVIGGRDEGFRAYASKANYSAGEWQVRVETTDNREIGRISFAIEKNEVPSGRARELNVDIQ